MARFEIGMVNSECASGTVVTRVTGVASVKIPTTGISLMNVTGVVGIASLMTAAGD